MATSYSVCLVTVPAEKAEGLVRGLLEAKLAACVNELKGARSTYWWEGKLERAEESLLVIKTRSGLLPDLTAFVRAHHPYDVPEVLCLSVDSGNPAYLDWLGANTLLAKQEEEEAEPGL